MVLFPALSRQSSNRFHCIVCVIGGPRHQLQVWTMLEKILWLFSLHLSACVSEQLRERARDLLWACIVFTPQFECVVPTPRQNDAFSSIGGPDSNPDSASVETLSLYPQWENWSMCPTSHNLHEVKRFEGGVCVLFIQWGMVTPGWCGTVGRTGLGVYCSLATVQEQNIISNTFTQWECSEYCSTYFERKDYILYVVCKCILK